MGIPETYRVQESVKCCMLCRRSFPMEAGSKVYCMKDAPFSGFSLVLHSEDQRFEKYKVSATGVCDEFELSSRLSAE